MVKILFDRKQDGEWPVFDILPGVIVVHAGIQAGVPTIQGTRIPTTTADGACQHGEWASYGDGLDEKKAYAAMCFEAGREYQRERRALDKVIEDAWAEYNRKHYPEQIKGR